MPALVLTIKETKTDKVLSTSELTWDGNNSRRVVGPHWNNHVAYQVKKTGKCTIIGDDVTYCYELHKRYGDERTAT